MRHIIRYPHPGHPGDFPNVERLQHVLVELRAPIVNKRGTLFWRHPTLGDVRLNCRELRRLVAQYDIGFETADGRRPGQWRQVKAPNAMLKNLVVWARFEPWWGEATWGVAS